MNTPNNRFPVEAALGIGRQIGVLARRDFFSPHRPQRISRTSSARNAVFVGEEDGWSSGAPGLRGLADKVSPASWSNAGNGAGRGAGAARPTAPTATHGAVLLPKNRGCRVPVTGGQNARFRLVQAGCGIRERGAAALVNDCRGGRRIMRQHGDLRSCLTGVRPTNRVETWSRRGSARLSRQGIPGLDLGFRSVASCLEGQQPFGSLGLGNAAIDMGTAGAGPALEFSVSSVQSRACHNLSAAPRSQPAMVPDEMVLSLHTPRGAAFFSGDRAR